MTAAVQSVTIAGVWSFGMLVGSALRGIFIDVAEESGEGEK
jgi:hypothetical protein